MQLFKTIKLVSFFVCFALTMIGRYNSEAQGSPISSLDSVSVGKQLLSLFNTVKFTTYTRKQQIDSFYFKSYSGLYRQEFLIANPNEAYNETDIRVNDMPYRRLISYGKDAKSRVAFIFYEMDSGLYLEIMRVKNNAVDEFLSFQVPLYLKGKNLSLIKAAIKKHEYYRIKHLPFPPLYISDEESPPVPNKKSPPQLRKAS